MGNLLRVEQLHAQDRGIYLAGLSMNTVNQTDDRQYLGACRD